MFDVHEPIDSVSLQNWQRLFLSLVVHMCTYIQNKSQSKGIILYEWCFSKIYSFPLNWKLKKVYDYNNYLFLWQRGQKNFTGKPLLCTYTVSHHFGLRVAIIIMNFSGSWDSCLNCPASARIISSVDFKHRTSYNTSFNNYYGCSSANSYNWQFITIIALNPQAWECIFPLSSFTEFKTPVLALLLIKEFRIKLIPVLHSNTYEVTVGSRPTRWPTCWPTCRWDRILYLYLNMCQLAEITLRTYKEWFIHGAGWFYMNISICFWLSLSISLKRSPWHVIIIIILI